MVGLRIPNTEERRGRRREGDEERGEREKRVEDPRRGEEEKRERGKASSDFLDFKGFQATIHQHLAKVDR